MARMMTGLLGLAALGGLAWWFFRPRGSSVSQFPQATLETQSRALSEGRSLSVDMLREIRDLVPAGAGNVIALRGLAPPIQVAQSPDAPGAFVVYIDDSLLPSPATPAIAGFGRFGQPSPWRGVRAGTRMLPAPAHATFPVPVGPSPAPRVLAQTPLGHGVAWHAGQLYQGGTHDTTSGVTGLWF